MNKRKLNSWLNIALAILFILLVITIVAGEATGDDSRQSISTWYLIHSVIGLLLMAGATIHLVIHRAFLKRMFPRNSNQERSKKSQQSLFERINVFLFITLGVPCIVSGLGLLLAGQEVRGLGGIHRMTGWILFSAFTYHVIRHLNWYIKRLRANKRQEKTIVSA